MSYPFRMKFLHIILCTIAFIAHISTANEAPQFPVFGAHMNMASRFRFLFEHQIQTDVTFELNDDAENFSIGAHRLVLMTQSRAMWTLLSGSAENDTIELNGVSKEAILQVLNFVYGSDLSLSANNVMDVLHAARTYDLVTLARRCLLFIHYQVTRDNALAFLQKGLAANEQAIIDRAKLFLETQTEYILPSNAFKEASRDIVTYIVELPVLASAEISLIRAVIDWARNQQILMPDSDVRKSETVREFLGDVFYKLRIPAISMEEFTHLIGPLNLLSDTEQLELFRYFTSSYEQRLLAGLPYETTVRQFSPGIDYALIATNTSCGLKQPATNKTRLASNSGYTVSFNMSSFNKFRLRGMRLAVPFVTNEFQIQPVSGLSVMIKGSYNCQMRQYREQVCDNYNRRYENRYRSVCLNKTMFADSISTNQIITIDNETAFVDITWNETAAITVHESTVLYIQYNFTLPKGFTINPLIREIAEGYFIKSADGKIQVRVREQSPLLGLLFSEYVEDGEELEINVDEHLNMDQDYGYNDYDMDQDQRKSSWWDN